MRHKSSFSAMTAIIVLIAIMAVYSMVAVSVKECPSNQVPVLIGVSARCVSADHAVIVMPR